MSRSYHAVRPFVFAALCIVSIECGGDKLLTPLSAPTLTSIGATSGVRGTTATLALVGTNFVPKGTKVVVSGSGVTATNVNVSSATAASASLVIDTSAALGSRNVTVSTTGGSSAAVTFTVNPPPPTLATVLPVTGVRGTTQTVTITGANFVTGATTVAVSGTGVTASNVNVTSATQLTAGLVIDPGAALGDRTMTITTAGGTSGTVTVSIVPPAPTLSTLSSATGVTNTGIDEILKGANFVAGATVLVSGDSVTTSNVVVVNDSTITVHFALSSNATPGARVVTVVTAGGTSGGVPFTVNAPAVTAAAAPTLTNLSPGTQLRGETNRVTLTGTNFLPGATTVNVSGAGVTVNTISVTSSTSLTALFVIGATADLGAHDVTVTTAGGTSLAVSVTVIPLSPALSSVSPSSGAQTGSQTVTLTGTNFVAGATTVSVSGANVTVSNVSVASSTSLTATFAVSGGAAISGRAVTVATTGGTSGAQTFAIVAPPAITTFSALATHLRAAQPSRLRWSTSNATTCSIDNGVGTVTSCNDSVFVTPGTTKSYTLSATSAGATVTASFQLFANEPGRFVYWTSSGGAAGTHVHQAAMDATTGGLTLIGSGTVTSGNTPDGIAVDPAGKYAYVANNTSNTVSMYSIDATTGALTSLGTKAAGTNPTEVVVDPTGRFAYVVNNNGGGTGSISRYTIDATGLLVANGSTTLGANSKGIAIDGTGRFLYATNRDAPSVQEFSINADGTLMALGTINTGSGTQPYYLAADPSGRYVYLTQYTQGKYSEYSINTDGTLSVLGGSPISLGSGTDIAIAVDPADRYAYIVDFNNAIIHEFTLDQSTGLLTNLTSPTLPHTLPTTQTVDQFAIDPQGKFAYATDNNNGQILLFTIGSGGTLSPVTAPLSTFAGGTNPFGIVVSP